jgi:hypothetical protein
MQEEEKQTICVFFLLNTGSNVYVFGAGVKRADWIASRLCLFVLQMLTLIS